MSIAEHVTGLQHLGLPTAALDETAAFYESLGFVRAHSTVNPGTGERVCFLTCGGLCIETYECAAPARRPSRRDRRAGAPSSSRRLSRSTAAGLGLSPSISRL